MKRMLALIMALALLTGCGASDCPGPEQETPAPVDGAPKVELPEPDPAGETETVSYELNYIQMSLELPQGWGYSLAGVPMDNGEVHAQPADMVGIRFWPDAAEDMGGGELALYYYADLFAVCGTGLQTQDITLDSGLTGSMGTYDNGTVWDFISFYDAPGSYAVMNEGADAWWEEYGAQAMSIIHSIRVGGDLMRESEAVQRAETACTVDYNSIRTTFDAVTGEWKVWFYRDYTAGGDQTVWIAPDGEFRTEYGE